MSGNHSNHAHGTSTNETLSTSPESRTVLPAALQKEIDKAEEEIYVFQDSWTTNKSNRSSTTSVTALSQHQVQHQHQNPESRDSYSQHPQQTSHPTSTTIRTTSAPIIVTTESNPVPTSEGLHIRAESQSYYRDTSSNTEPRPIVDVHKNRRAEYESSNLSPPKPLSPALQAAVDKAAEERRAGKDSFEDSWA